MLKIIRLFFLLFILSPTHLFAQNNPIVAGYYINLEGDTTRGTFPKYQDWVNNPNEVKFTPSAGGNLLQLTTANCKMFRADNYDTYVAYSGTRLINGIDYNSDLEVDSSDLKQNINTFLRVLFDDKNFKLFIFQDKIRTNFFYQNDNSPIIELVHKLYIDKDNNPATVNTYQLQLKQLFSNRMEAKDIERATDNLEYKENDLVHLAQRAFGSIEKKTRIKYPNSFFVTAGVALNSMKVVGDGSRAEVGTKYSASISPVINIGYIAPVQRNFGRLCFSAQFKLYNYKNSGDDFQTLYGDSIYTHTTFKADLLIMPALYATYAIINNKHIQWNIGPGVAYSLLVGANEDATTTETFRSTHTTITEGKKTIVTINFQTSLIVDRCFIFMINHSLGAVTNTDTGFGSNHSSTQFTAGWVFTCK